MLDDHARDENNKEKSNNQEKITIIIKFRVGIGGSLILHGDRRKKSL